MSLIDRSNQRWKLYLFIALMALGAGVTLLQGFLYGPLGKELTLQLVMGGMLLVVGAFVWACRSVTCPQCGLKLFWHALVKVGFGSWFVWLLTEEKCPNCGAGGRPAASGGSRVRPRRSR